MILTTFKQIQDPKQGNFSAKKANSFFYNTATCFFCDLMKPFSGHFVKKTNRKILEQVIVKKQYWALKPKIVFTKNIFIIKTTNILFNVRCYKRRFRMQLKAFARVLSTTLIKNFRCHFYNNNNNIFIYWNWVVTRWQWLFYM